MLHRDERRTSARPSGSDLIASVGDVILSDAHFGGHRSGAEALARVILRALSNAICPPLSNLEGDRCAASIDVLTLSNDILEAGLVAWESSAGDEYPRLSTTNAYVLQDIFGAMMRAASNSSQ